MSDTFYFFYQPTFKSSWTLALASERERINRDLKPELNTVLDVNSPMEKEMDLEARGKLRYRGDAYFDFDSEDTEDVIVNFKEFLTNLQAKGANLNSLRLYCSGGKGFHVELPACMLMAKIPVNGIAALPLIYREVAHELFVNTLDLRVYSQGKGRQWRQPNIKREKGTYKVQITVDEAMEMTVERYAELIAHPRPVFPVETAVFTPDLALIYAKCRSRVEDGLRTVKKRKATGQELKRFAGQWPETLQKVLSGQGLKENVGWNYIVIQLATTAVELGKSEDQMVEDAKGLLETYRGDSDRYGNPKKRERELRDKHRLFQENPCYSFSVGGILSMVDKETQANTDLNLGDFVPDAPLPEGEEAEDVPDDEEETTQVRVNRQGIWSRTEHGWKRISDVGLANVTLLRLPNGQDIGYDVDTYVKGNKQCQLTMTKNDIGTKASLHNLFLRDLRSSFKGTDMDASHLVDYLRDRVVAKAQVSLVTQVEGLDLILPPNAKTKDDVEIIWSSPQGVITTGSNQYVFKSSLTGKPSFNSDLWQADSLGAADSQMIEDLLGVNTPQNLARMLGWFAATFLCPVLRRYYHQFPLLQIYGGASAGKSKTIALLSHMHYHLHTPKITSASQYTPFALLAAVAASSSLPVYLEELRQRFLGNGKWENAINVLKSSYDGHSVERGGLGNKGEGPVVNVYACTAPIVYIAEEKNGEVAVQERSVSVCLSEMDRYGRDQQYDRLLENATDLGHLGKSMVQNALSLNIPQFRTDFNEIVADIKLSMGKARDGKDRPIFNLATTIMGLRFMQAAVQQACGSDFDSHFSVMNDAIRDNVTEFVPQNMSEASRVLDTMAQLTKVLDVQYKMEYGREYTVSPDGSTVDLKLKPAYAKYMKYVRSLGTSPLYDSDQAFIAAMSRYGGVTTRACVDNDRLFGGPAEPVYRLSAAFLQREQVESFKP